MFNCRWNAFSLGSPAPRRQVVSYLGPKSPRQRSNDPYPAGFRMLGRKDRAAQHHQRLVRSYSTGQDLMASRALDNATETATMYHSPMHIHTRIVSRPT